MRKLLAVAVTALLAGCAGSMAESQIRSGVAAYREQPPEIKAITRLKLDQTTKPCVVRLWCPGEPLPDFGLPPALTNSTP